MIITTYLVLPVVQIRFLPISKMKESHKRDLLLHDSNSFNLFQPFRLRCWFMYYKTNSTEDLPKIDDKYWKSERISEIGLS